MISAFDQLKDETPPTQGQEIGAAVSGAIAEIGKAGESAAKIIAEAMAEALRKSDQNAPTITSPAPIVRWVFDIEHADDGRMARVIATAERQ